MDTIFWLVLFFMVGSSFWRYLKQVGDEAEKEAENDDIKDNRLPASSRPLPENIRQTRLNIPEYLTKREEETGEQLSGSITDANTYWEAEHLMVSYGQKPEQERAIWDEPTPQHVEATAQKVDGKQKQEHEVERLFDDLLAPRQVIKGMVWSQILGHRGGLRHHRR